MPTEQWLERPLKEFIRTVAVSVAESQEDLDRRAIRVQREIEEAIDEGTLSPGLDASWLQFSGVDADLKLTISMEGEEVRDQSGTVRAYRPQITVRPINPQTRRTIDVEADITSDVKLRIIPVPPERQP